MLSNHSSNILKGFQIFLLLQIICVSNLFAQIPSFLEKYENVVEASITDMYTKHDQVAELIANLKTDSRFRVQEIGSSIEGRAIYSIQIGTGETQILMWSQMHGDEPTATMAIMDLINYFKDRTIDEELKKEWLEKLTITIIPMLNPDGAERFQRRNAVQIDLNRDAARLQCPESKILKQMVENLSPDWGFNLHDQSRYYAAGRSSKPATFSFLAPAYNYERDINEIRKSSMQLIVDLNKYITTHTNFGVGRYNDAFEPRAFGDNITKWGTSTVLIECGGLKGDPQKQQIRKVHFGLFLYAFDCIAHKKYANNTVDAYLEIPENKRIFHDLILKNVLWKINGHDILIDIGFKKKGDQAYLADVGDLSTYKAYKEVDLHGYLLTMSPSEHTNGQDNKNRDTFKLGENPTFELKKDGQSVYQVKNGELKKL